MQKSIDKIRKNIPKRSKRFKKFKTASDVARVAFTRASDPGGGLGAPPPQERVRAPVIGTGVDVSEILGAISAAAKGMVEHGYAANKPLVLDQIRCALVDSTPTVNAKNFKSANATGVINRLLFASEAELTDALYDQVIMVFNAERHHVRVTELSTEGGGAARLLPRW